MEEKEEYTAEERKAELVEYLNNLADSSLTAEGFAQAVFAVKRFFPPNDKMVTDIAVDVAGHVSNAVKALAKHAEALDIKDIEKLLDPPEQGGVVKLFDKDLVHNIRSMHLGPVSIAHAAATDQLGLDLYRSVEWRVKGIAKAMKEGN